MVLSAFHIISTRVHVESRLWEDVRVALSAFEDV
jgi:hypothetical protein